MGNRMIWLISKWLLSPSPCQEHERTFFSNLYSENLKEFLEVKLSKVWGLQKF